ncbi:MAG TPA: hypothetical protein VMV49_00545 [Candidatus Deferrimicrobium sp.]|nr:hypothetical protein [Candidatus Deferrimicrobium sp.]
MSETKKPGTRDTDLTIWAIISFIAAAGAVAISVGLLSGRIYERMSTTIIQFISDNFNTSALPFWPPTEMLFIGAGVITLIFAAIFAIVGYGIFNVKPWARTMAIIIGFLLISAGGIGIIILWFFWRKDTKELFAASA